MSRNTSPGGWVEIQDWDCRLRCEDGSTEGTSIAQWYDLVIGAFEKRGYDPIPGAHSEEWFRDIGFVNVSVHEYIVPMGAWPKDEKLVSAIFAQCPLLKD